MKSTSGRPVLIVALAKNFGGADVRVLTLAQALHGHRDYFVAALENSPLHNRLLQQQLNTIAVPYGRGDMRTALFLRDVVRNTGAMIIDAHNPQSQFWGLLATLGMSNLKRVQTVHSSYRYEHNNSLKGKLYEQVLRLNNYAGSQFIAVSESVQDYLKEIHTAEKRVSLIHNSIISPSPSDTSALHPLYQQLGWNEEHLKIISVGRLEAVKGHSLLIDAIAEVVKDQNHVRCLIVGDGRLREALTAQIERTGMNDYIYLAGFREDIGDLLSSSDIFCMPSLSEGLPYALLEACGAHLPLLVSRVGGMARLLQDQVTAYLFESGDVRALRDAILWSITHPEEMQRLSQNAFEWQRDTFGVEQMIERTIAVYDGETR